LILVVVFFDDFLEIVDVFDERFPLFISFFKFIFYWDSVMIMFSVKDNAIAAEKCLSMVFAGFYIAIEKLNVSTIAVALDIVVGNPVVENRCLLRHFSYGK
jgi:hypothetical protein